ncbi:MAG: UDP-N-acetylmuramate--L-alanine ligase [Ornithinibacter sp.]
MDGIAPRFDVTGPVPVLDGLGHVHLVAIGGAGMSAVARLLLARGLEVSGSDRADGPVLDDLRADGATVFVGHAAEHVKGADTVVVSSAIPEDNVELAAARAAGLLVLHRSQALAATMAGTRRVAVAGANGKTTTTSMLIVALAHAGVDPSFAVGAEIGQLATNAAIGRGKVFVVEADESDGSFLAYRPDVAIVTNVQPDHLDFYGSVAAVRQAYAAFAGSITDGGLLVACDDDPGSRELAERMAGSGIRVVTYGSEVGADLRIGASSSQGLGTSTPINHLGTKYSLELRVPGWHNVENACAAVLAATVGLGVDIDDVLAGLATFAGARRRFEVRGEVRGVTVVDDYAHNAPKVAAVVGTAAEIVRRSGAGALRVIFQPHLYSRTRDFAADFAHALAEADDVVILDVYGAREEPMEGVSSALVASPLTGFEHGPDVVEVGGSMEDAARRVARRSSGGDLVLTVGAGDVTRLAAVVLQTLGESGGEQS